METLRSVVILFLLFPILLSIYGVAQGPVAVSISAPDFAGTGDIVPVSVSVAGGPGEDNGTFSIKAFLRGPDMEGATPVEDSPLEKTSSDKVFEFNLTMPTTEQQVELVVEVNSTKGSQWRTATATKTITVLVPIRVTAQVTNEGQVELKNVPAYLYVDGQKVNETVIDILKPGESKEITFEYLPVGLGVGSHVLEIRVDINNDGVIDPALGEVVLRKTFTKEAEPINPIYIVLAFVAAFVVALFVGAAIRQRRSMKK